MLDGLIEFCKRMAELGVNDNKALKFSREMTHAVNSANRRHNAHIEDTNEMMDVGLEGLEPYDWVERNMARYPHAYSDSYGDHYTIMSEIEAYWTKSELEAVYPLPGEAEATAITNAYNDGVDSRYKRSRDRSVSYDRLREEESKVAKGMFDCAEKGMDKIKKSPHSHTETSLFELLDECQETNVRNRLR